LKNECAQILGLNSFLFVLACALLVFLITYSSVACWRGILFAVEQKESKNQLKKNQGFS